jgi:O-antigen ligase
MIRQASKINTYSVVLALFCIANVLELFIPRMEEGNYFVRIPIQLIDGLVLFLMWAELLTRKINWTPLTIATLCFMLLAVAYAVPYFTFTSFNTSDFAPYLRFLLWTTSVIFFSEMMGSYGMQELLMRVYIITFILSVAKKILEDPKFEADNLGAGDTAALPLLFIIPIVLICFNIKFKFIFMSLISLLILFSLRRTVILGLVVCMPFVYKYFSKSLKAYHLVILGILFVGVIYFTWGYIGEAIVYRFENLLLGDSGGTKESFGSGRSEFYMTVWTNWENGNFFSLLFGHGLTSVQVLLLKYHGIRHAHNDFLEIIFTYGILGIVVWLSFLFQLWKLKSQIRLFSPETMNLFYICFISYGVIAMASGCILRITTLPFGFTIAVLIHKVQEGKGLLTPEDYSPSSVSEETQASVQAYDTAR